MPLSRKRRALRQYSRSATSSNRRSTTHAAQERDIFCPMRDQCGDAADEDAHARHMHESTEGIGHGREGSWRERRRRRGLHGGQLEIGRNFRLDKPRPSKSAPICHSSGRRPRRTANGQVSQARIRVTERGTPPIVGSCASAKSTNASNPRNTISNAAMPTAIFIPCPAPSINATMRLEGGGFASLSDAGDEFRPVGSEGTPPRVTGCPSSGNASLLMSTAQGIEIIDAEIKCPAI